MAEVLGVVIGVASVAGVGTLIKVSIEVSKSVIKKIRRTKEKKVLKINIKESIENLNYTNFVNVIYQIKQYDDKYNKNMYVKVKNQYLFGQVHIDNLHYFKRRFDSDYIENEKYIKELIHKELSLSLSVMQDRLDL